MRYFKIKQIQRESTHFDANDLQQTESFTGDTLTNLQGKCHLSSSNNI